MTDRSGWISPKWAILVTGCCSDQRSWSQTPQAIRNRRVAARRSDRAVAMGEVSGPLVGSPRESPRIGSVEDDSPRLRGRVPSSAKDDAHGTLRFWRRGGRGKFRRARAAKEWPVWPGITARVCALQPRLAHGLARLPGFANALMAARRSRQARRERWRGARARRQVGWHWI